MKTLTSIVGRVALSEPERRRVPLRRSLMFRVPAILVGGVLVILGLVVLVMELAVKPRLRDLADKSVAQSSALIGEELRKRVTVARTLCQELARTGELLAKDVSEHQRVIPAMIDGVGDGWFVAGGGIWPEPGRFTPGVERRSFFFGRQPDGTLKYFDEYNDPAGPGYHHEEWYVPVRHVGRGGVYWSRSYIDPYSHEPMVTCSAPIYRDGEYYGVATIDVKLSGLRELFHTSTEAIGGYAFAVDREGVFLTFPNDALIRTVRRDGQSETAAFLSTHELAAKHPVFGRIAEVLDGMDAAEPGRPNSARVDAIARAIDEDSYQIDARQAGLIAGLLTRNRGPEPDRQIDVGNDLQLSERSIVMAHQMPDTGWKIVTVMPESRVFAASLRLYHTLLASLGAVLLACFAGTLLLLYRDIVRPVTRITRALHAASGRQALNLTLPVGKDDELGLLARTLNSYSQSLSEAITEVEQARGELEVRVADRTRAYQESNAALEIARREADGANRAKSEFLANMSHEIRTPLTAILGYTDILREQDAGKLSPDIRSQHLETIAKAGTHLLSVINDILDLSKIEAGQMTTESVPTPLPQILAELESLIRPKAAVKKIGLHLRLLNPIPNQILADPTRLRQILMNLAGNAVKFTDRGQVGIEVSSRSDGTQDNLVVDITDSGPGLNPQQSARLFSPFSQADGTVTRVHGGTGLGLAISRRLARLMAGDVTLEWSEPGRGSRFRITLPLRPAPNAQSVAALGGTDPVHTAPSATEVVALAGRVLLAEDGPDNQRLICFHLRRAGARVDVAENGRIALEMLDAAARDGEPYALLLTDMQMPEMDGYALARAIRFRADLGQTLPIVALTAHAMAEDRRRCVEAGCDDYATKPINAAALLQVCRKWMGASRTPNAAPPAGGTAEPE